VNSSKRATRTGSTLVAAIMRQTCIFSGSSHPTLVEAICQRLGKEPDKVELRKFSNGETSVEIKTSVRDQDVFIIQSGSSKINDNVIELLIMISACKSGSARSITAVMPYFPYSRQSKRKSHRGAITARMIANLMHVAGVNHFITIDLHASQSQGFFKCPVDNLIAEPILAKWIKNYVRDWQNAVVVSKNPGGTKRVTSLADALKLSFGIVTTDRRRAYTSNSMNNSAIFGSMGLDGTMDDKLDDELESEPRTFPDLPASMAPTQHDFAYDEEQNAVDRESITDAMSSRNSGPRPAHSLVIPQNAINRFNHGISQPSPLAHSTRAESVDVDAPASAAQSSSGSDRSSQASRGRADTTTGPTQRSSFSDSGYEVEEEGDEYNDERAQDVVTGRLIHGHIVEDDQPSPAISAMSSSTHHHPRKSSEDDPPDNMFASFMSAASMQSHRQPEHGLGGTADATASDEEEEEALADPELETTITLVGNVRNRPVLIVDDIIDKSGSWIAAAETAVIRGGATKVVCMATHGLFGADSLQEMQACPQIDHIVVTNAFPIPEDKRKGVHKLVVLDVSNLLSEAIRRNHHGESISQLYQHYD